MSLALTNLLFCFHYKGIKPYIKIETGLICWDCEGVIYLNAGAFTWVKARDMQANLCAFKNVVNLKATKDLLCFISDNRERNKIPSRVTFFFSTNFFN